MAKTVKAILHQQNKAQRRRDLIFVLCMLAIPVLHFIVFWIWPNLRGILIAFKVPSVDGFTLYNYERYFKELTDPITAPAMWKMIENSFIMFGVGTFVNLPMVLFMSYVMFKKVTGYKVFRVLFYLPSIIGSTVMSQIYKSMLTVRGPIHSVLVAAGVEFNEYAGLLGAKETGMLMIIIYSLWLGVGSNLIMFSGAMNRVPQDIFESARIDGVGFFREFFDIILPLIWPTVTTMVIFSMCGVFSNAGIVMLLCPDNTACHNVGYYILRFTLNANNTVKVDDSFGYPAAVGQIFSLVNLPLVFGTKWICERIGKNVEY